MTKSKWREIDELWDITVLRYRCPLCSFGSNQLRTFVMHLLSSHEEIELGFRITRAKAGKAAPHKHGARRK